MKLLWANSSFLHPTNRGGQIRTLEMLRQLHRWHHVDYAALADPDEPEGVLRASEYCTRAFPFEFRPPSKRSARFFLEIALSPLSNLPLAVSRWRAPQMLHGIEALLRAESYDAVVCDFLVTAINFPDLSRAVLFEHNVETIIWQRHAENAPDPLRSAYFTLQARRMLEFESTACRKAAHVIAVSQQDAATIRRMFGVTCSAVPTGVNVEYFRPPEASERKGLVFVGSMDWMPNIDGINWFAECILPLIRKQNKDLPVTIVGRNPPAGILALAYSDPCLHVTGTVPDVRPYLWSSSVSIVPLRIGGGTRLKIYESMAAGLPVVSTRIGAEGLDVRDGDTIALADEPSDFAQRCIELAADPPLARRLASAGSDLVVSRYSWERVARSFEQLLIQAVEPAGR